MSENKDELKIVVVKDNTNDQQQILKTTTITTTKVETVARKSVQSKAAESPSSATKKPDTKKSKRAFLVELFEKCYVDPFGEFYYRWLIIISGCYFYNLIFLIARASFWLLEVSDYNFAWYLVDYLLCDLSYVIDILIRFLTGFIEDGELCTKKLKIAKRYMWSLQFKLDVLSVLPTEMLIYLEHHVLKYVFGRATIKTILFEHSRRLSAAFRLNRLLRFSRLNEFRSITETKTKYPTIFRMSNLLINILVGMHWNACIYFLVSNLIGFGHDKWVYPRLTTQEQLANLTQSEIDNMLLTHRLDVQYIYCFWWSALTLTTVAEVQNPQTYYQEIYMSVLLMTGVIILAITIGSAGDMVENASRRSLELQMKCDYAKSFLTQNKITGELETRIKNYLDYLYLTPDLQGGDVLEILPYNLQKEIAMNVHIETLKRVKIFQDCEPGLLEELVTKLKLQIYSPGDYVCRKGDVGYEMYFIKMGSLQVVSPDGKQVFATLGAGAAFGEISILDIPGNKNGNKRTANIRSFGFSDVFQLSKHDLWSALSEFPVAKKTLMEKGKALLQKDNLLDEEVAAKIEQKMKPINEQIEYFQTSSLASLDTKLDDLYKMYTNYMIETNKLLKSIESKLGIKHQE